MSADDIRIDILSGASFGRGEGTAGEVDLEIMHDDLGLPELPARTLKGLLRDAWLTMADAFPTDASAAEDLLGVEGALPGSSSRMVLHTGRLAGAVRKWVCYACLRPQNPIPPGEILRALTVVRRQTARDRGLGGSPDRGTLRATRVLLPGIYFIAPVEVPGAEAVHWRVLARCCLGVREAGSGRNRGRGALRLSLRQGGRDVTASLAGV